MVQMVWGHNENKSFSESGDARGHVSRLKKHPLGSRLCFNLYQICVSVAETVSPHYKSFLLLPGGFQAAFYFPNPTTKCLSFTWSCSSHHLPPWSEVSVRSNPS